MAMDPFIGKALQTAVKTGTEGAGNQGAGMGQGESLFKDVMMQMGSEQQDIASALKIPQTDLDGRGAIHAVSAEGFDPLPMHLDTGSHETGGMEFVSDMLSRMNASQNKMEGMFNKMAFASKQGEQLPMQDLLRIQGHIYMWSQEVELGVKVASEGVSSLRTVLNTQVQ